MATSEPRIIDNATIYTGDALECLRQLPDKCVQCCVTSPPYYNLRDYGVDGQIGLEDTPEKYIEKLVDVFGEVKRVLKNDGTCWVNIGDSYAAGGRGENRHHREKMSIKTSIGQSLGPKKPTGDLKKKDLIGIPWMLAFALRSNGWYLRSEIIWHKLNAMPESVTDRPSKAHEQIFLLSKSQKYYYDADAIKEKSILGGSIDEFRNKRSVWSLPTIPYTGSHFAVFPPLLIEPCILAGSQSGDLILDPFFGSGTTGEVALKHGRKVIGIELNPEYTQLWTARVKRAQRQLVLTDEGVL